MSSSDIQQARDRLTRSKTLWSEPSGSSHQMFFPRGCATGTVFLVFSPRGCGCLEDYIPGACNSNKIHVKTIMYIDLIWVTPPQNECEIGIKRSSNLNSWHLDLLHNLWNRTMLLAQSMLECFWSYCTGRSKVIDNGGYVSIFYGQIRFVVPRELGHA